MYAIQTKKSRMFDKIDDTWNPITGCQHYCVYCWAMRFVEKRLRKVHEKYKDGFFTAKIHEKEFSRRFKRGSFIFVVDMGDLFGSWVPSDWIQRVIEYIEQYPQTEFLFLTKNPEKYSEFTFPENAWLGATIETNNDLLYQKNNISKAPLPSKRIEAMKKLDWDKKFVSIEPILDFDLETFYSDIVDIDPAIIYVGYDNYNHRLPEPRYEKTLELIKLLTNTGFEVRTKTLRKAWYE